MIKHILATVAIAAATVCGSAHAQATNYPTKPVTIVVPFSPGGATDIMSRTLAERLKNRLGHPVIVENKPGAGTMIASEYVAKAAPDGHTVLLAASSLGIAPSLYAKVNYDPVKDFTPISLVASVVHVLSVHPSVPAKNVAELVTWVKANPTKANYGSVGAGTSTHLESELFNTMAGVKMEHVPYKGSAPALTDVMGGQADLMFDTMLSSMPHVKAGKLKALAVTSSQRSPSAPAIPTVAESGLPGYEAIAWNGVLAPAGTPKEVVDRLNAELKKALDNPEVKQRFEAQGFAAAWSTPTAYAGFLQAEVDKWGKVVKASGAKID